MKKHVGKLILSMLACACIVFATVVTDYNHAVDFHKYKTYSWIKVKVDDPLWEDRITRAVDTQLVAKGWGKVPMNGDAAIAAYGSVHEKKSLETWYSGFGGGWHWRGWGGAGLATTTVDETPVGTLAIDIFDGSTQGLIWRGRASETLTSKPEKDEKKLDKIVAEMFKKFPPPSKD